MYIMVLMLILIGTITELFLKKNLKIYFYFVIGILSFMLLFRYGQGTDYFGYKYLFSVTPTSFSKTIDIYHNYHGEIGWFLLMSFFKKLDLSFNYLVFFSALLTLLLLYRIIRKSPYKFLSLLLLYPTYYLTYCFSAIRQGIVLAVFLGILVPIVIENKKKYFYYIICILLCTIHKTAFIFLILPSVLYLIKRITKKQLYVIILIFICLVNMLILINDLYKFVNISNYLEVHISIFAILIRTIYFAIISFFHNKNEHTEHKIENIIYYIYSFGFIIYISLMSMATLSQRLTMPLKSLEILLIPIEINLFLQNRKKSNIYLIRKIKVNKQTICNLCIIFFIGISIVETIKNINAYIGQGNYYNDVNIFSYPYISYFNKEDIYNYRIRPKYDVLVKDE